LATNDALPGGIAWAFGAAVGDGSSLAITGKVFARPLRPAGIYLTLAAGADSDAGETTAVICGALPVEPPRGTFARVAEAPLSGHFGTNPLWGPCPAGALLTIPARAGDRGWAMTAMSALVMEGRMSTASPDG
jgi:hypothetical protein